MDIVTTALDYYDKHNETFETFVSKIKYFKYIRKFGDMERNVIELYDKNKKKILKSKVEHVGSYYSIYKLWTWAWAVPVLEKNTSYISKKLFDYGLSMSSDENLYLRTELITSRFRITNPLQLDTHIAISAYLGKHPYILKILWYPDIPVSKDGYILYTTEDKMLSPDKTYEIFYLYILDYKSK